MSFLKYRQVESMCVVCDNIDKYNEEYPLGLNISTELTDPLDTILIYFHLVEEIQSLCLSQIKKKAYKAITNSGQLLADNETSKSWFHNQCFYDLWIQFKQKIQLEKKKLNEDISYTL